MPTFEENVWIKGDQLSLGPGSPVTAASKWTPWNIRTVGSDSAPLTVSIDSHRPIGLGGGGTSSFTPLTVNPWGVEVVGQANNAGLSATSDSGPGVSAQSKIGTGVAGKSDSGVGVAGKSDSGVAVDAQTNTGYGIKATGPGEGGDSGGAGLFNGRVIINGILKVNDINVYGDVKLWGGDIAERFPIVSTASSEAGTVMSIGDDGFLVPCAEAYDTRVLGVVSGAGDLQPAVTLRHLSDNASGAVIALSGTVYCMAEADKWPIKAGDLLTSSSVVGHAMKAANLHSAAGAIIGKALGELEHGRGLIPMVVCLR